MTDELLISRCRLAEEIGKALARGRAMLDALIGEPGAAAGDELAAAVLALCDYVDRLESTLNNQVEAVAAHRPQELDGIAAKAELLQTVACLTRLPGGSPIRLRLIWVITWSGWMPCGGNTARASARRRASASLHRRYIERDRATVVETLQ